MSGDWCQSVACLYSLIVPRYLQQRAYTLHRRQTLLRLKTSAADLVPGRTESDTVAGCGSNRTTVHCTYVQYEENIRTFCCL